ncbi:MAG: hypothetical protein LJF04_13245 [Gemmatimonadetes bacterium]|nr:hypothetical protein [Gemmatimonadota bacterium]
MIARARYLRGRITVLELLNTRKSIRLEWYIVALIVVEIVLLIWQMLGGATP